MLALPRSAYTAGPHVRKADERLAFVPPASHHFKRHAAKPQGIRQFRRLLLIDTVHKHPGCVRRNGFDSDRVFQHLEQGKVIRQRLGVRAKKISPRPRFRSRARVRYRKRRSDRDLCHLRRPLPERFSISMRAWRSGSCSLALTTATTTKMSDAASCPVSST